MSTWELSIPAVRGRLPSGEPVHRTEPNGPVDAPIVIVGVYPAARVAGMSVHGVRMNLPVEVERRSFDTVSASGREIDAQYLAPLGLTRDDVLLLDVMPYFLANVRKSGERTMWRNIQEYERLTGEQLGIEPRPTPASLVEQARAMPGNVERIRHYLLAAERRLVLTLGVEAAAFARGESLAETDRRKHEAFYADPVRGFGDLDLAVVHLSHPGNLMATRPAAARWRERHATWCTGPGRRLVHSLRSS